MAFSMKRPELLSPAGNLEKLRTALSYGVIGMAYSGRCNPSALRNRLRAGEKAEPLFADDNIPIDTAVMFDENENITDRAHAGSRIYLPFSTSVPEGTILRKRAVADQ
jgi:hypothetical protein